MNRLFLLASASLFVAVVPACSSSSITSTPTPTATDTDAGAAPEEDSGLATDVVRCSEARKAHLVPIAKVSTGEVKVLSTEAGVTTLYVDASGGGAMESASSPRVYIKLTGEQIAITDDASFASSDWDLALKRVDVYTNSGDAGPGKGGASKLSKDFEAVSAADVDDASIRPEAFFDDECVGRKDEASFIVTTFSGWYDYVVGGGVTVKPKTTFIVRGADGASRYKLGIVSYTGTSAGGSDGKVSGRYILQVAPL